MARSLGGTYRFPHHGSPSPRSRAESPRVNWRAVRWFVLVTIGLAVALGLRPISVREIIAAYVLSVAAIALAALTRLNARDPWEPVSDFERALRPRVTERVRPPELVRLERELTLASANAGHLHTRLLPLLRDAATVRLAARRRIDLFRHPDEASQVLGDEAWELIRPDRPEPPNSQGSGLSLRRIGRLIDAIENI